MFSAFAIPPEVRERMRELNPTFPQFHADPAYIMPVGSGDLSAIAGFQNGIEMQLGKTDFWGHATAKYHYTPLLLSPGRLRLFPELSAQKLTSFRQTMELESGRVRFELGTATGKLDVTIRGIMEKNTLLVEVRDFRSSPDALVLEYENHRSAQTRKIQNGRFLRVEKNLLQSNRKPLPSGQKPSPTDLIYGLTLHLGITVAEQSLAVQHENAERLRMRVDKASAHYRIFITAETTREAEHVLARQDVVMATPELEKQQTLWWDRYWNRAYVILRGDADADYLNRLWFVNLYSFASVGSGKYPPRFSGGLGTVRADDRSWGHGFWFQNQRELSWPLGAANQLEMWRKQLDFYDSFFDYRQQETHKVGKDGIFFPEWLPARRLSAQKRTRTPVTAELLEKELDLRLESRKGGYTGHIYSAGAEWIVLMEDYIAYSGDKVFAEEVFAPWLHEISLFFVKFLKKGEDGLCHMEPADSVEQFRKVRDPAPDLAGVRRVFEAALRDGTKFNFEPLLLTAIRERYKNLPSLPTGFRIRTRKQQAVREAADVYAPLREFLADTGSYNQENPELYAVYPFAMVDARSPRESYERMVRTFRTRNYPNRAGWSQCPVQAARLHLPETHSTILDHAKRHQHYPYGGWNSPGKKLAGSSLDVSDAPYLDSAGVNTTAIQEMLLQSHAGKSELLPAVPPNWSGSFRLRARDGFLYQVRFGAGRKIEYVEHVK